MPALEPVVFAASNAFLSLKFDPSYQMLYAPWWKYFDLLTAHCCLLTDNQYEISYTSRIWRIDLYHYYTGTICMQPAIAKQSDYRRRHPLRKLSGVYVNRSRAWNVTTPTEHCFITDSVNTMSFSNREQCYVLVHNITTKSMLLTEVEHVS